jgi:alpha-L-fucosidase
MMQPWFSDAKFGIFIHWGIYSLGNAGESWPFFNGEVSYEDYMAQASEFTAEKYDPDEWARLFAQAGAKYAVLTAKHHDGFALWHTKESTLNAVEASPAGRDLIGPYCDALRKHGLKVGIYYSHLDWSHPDYASVLPTGAQPHDHAQKHSNRFAYPQGEQNPQAWERFLQFHRAQLKELCTQYKPDLLWFDGDWERDPEQWRFAELKDQLQEWAPGVIVNSRMGGHGDYGTPEQAIPIAAPEGPWEFCVTGQRPLGLRARRRQPQVAAPVHPNAGRVRGHGRQPAARHRPQERRLDAGRADARSAAGRAVGAQARRGHLRNAARPAARPLLRRLHALARSDRALPVPLRRAARRNCG